MQETWKDIPGYEGLYQCSDLGRLRSLGRTTADNRFLKGKLMKPYPIKNGYIYANLYTRGSSKRLLFHRLVMLTFIGDSELAVDHIDSDKTNNALSNLRYCTARENSLFHLDKVSPGKTRGVSKTPSGNWRARIRIEGKDVHLGTFPTEEEAGAAYKEAKAKLVN